MKIPVEIVEEIRQRSDLVALAGEYVELRKRGQNFLGLCPFHSETTPSFAVHPAKQKYHCFGCGVGGDVFDFVARIERTNFLGATKILAARAGIKMGGFKPSPELTAKIAAIKSQRDNELAFKRFCDERITAINRRYRALGRAATHAEDCLRAGESDPYVHEMAWAAIQRYIDFQNRIEREGLCDPEVLKAEWEQQRVAA